MSKDKNNIGNVIDAMAISNNIEKLAYDILHAEQVLDWLKAGKPVSATFILDGTAAQNKLPFNNELLTNIAVTFVKRLKGGYLEALGEQGKILSDAANEQLAELWPDIDMPKEKAQND